MIEVRSRGHGSAVWRLQSLFYYITKGIDMTLQHLLGHSELLSYADRGRRCTVLLGAAPALLQMPEAADRV